MTRRGAIAAIGICALGLTLAAGRTTSAEAAATPASCWIDAKTGKPAPSPRVTPIGNRQDSRDRRSGRHLTRAPCPASALPVEAQTPPAAPAWWVSAEPLMWWVKSTPLSPTLTTYAAGSPSATTGFGGELGVPGTTVLSPDRMGYAPFGGGRLTIGRWLDSDPNFGLEASGFFLGDRSAGFSESSSGAPPLRVPFFNVPPGVGFPLGNSSFVLADPGFAAGSQAISSSLRFWGVEADGLYHALNNERVNLSLLAGARYLDLAEGLSIVSRESVPGVGIYTATDNFSTRNQFFGADFGAKAQAQFGRFDGSLLAKVALGDNYQTVTVGGNSSVVGFGILSGGSTPAGLFAQATNIGQRNRNQFSVAPELQVQVGYEVTSAVHVFVGYDFLYLSDVVRPGKQIDSTLNLTGNALLSGSAAPTLIGAARPQSMFNNSSFWAQGVNVGLRYEF